MIVPLGTLRERLKQIEYLDNFGELTRYLAPLPEDDTESSMTEQDLYARGTADTFQMLSERVAAGTLPNDECCLTAFNEYRHFYCLHRLPSTPSYASSIVAPTTDISYSSSPSCCLPFISARYVLLCTKRLNVAANVV